VVISVVPFFQVIKMLTKFVDPAQRPTKKKKKG